MKRRLVLVVPALLVLAGCGHAVVVEPAAATSSARSSSTPAAVVDDPCLPGDPSCSAPAPIPEAPAPAAVAPAVTVPGPVCGPGEDVDTDSPTGCITSQLPEESTGRAYG